MVDQLMGGGAHVPDNSSMVKRLRPPRRMYLIAAAVAVSVLLVVLALIRSVPTRADPLPARGLSGPVNLTMAPRSSTPVVPDPGTPDRITRSKQGAVNAAARYATLLAELFPLDTEQAKAVVTDDASDAARDRLVDAIDANLIPLQQRAGDLNGVTTYRQAVLATHLVSYSADPPATVGSAQRPATAAWAAARVRVWTLLTVSHTPEAGTTLQGDSNAIGSFGIVVLSLLWERGAWRIDDSTTLDGPTPLIDGTPSTGTGLNSVLRGFTDWRP